MGHINIEIKAICKNQNKIRQILKSKNAKFIRTDHQIDTYFKANKGKLKLREGKLENHLIFYEREKKAGPKQSKIILFKSNPKSTLKESLTNALRVLVIVDKKREIYQIDNVVFHLDNVKNLGKFIEIEAIDYKGTIGKKKLLKQCQDFLKDFKILKKDLLSDSYSDLLIQNAKKN